MARRRAPLAAVATATIGLVLLLISGCATATGRERATHRVAIRSMRFEPAVLRIAPGDTVRWTNFDLVPHTVTSLARAFDSGNLPPDSSWALVSTSGGTVDYACLYHASMRGSLVSTP
jgi:plastocyanin